MSLDLTGKRALVCGASRGIGKGCAVELARLGAEVIVVARGAAGVQAAVEELPRHPDQEHDHIVADFSEPNHAENTIRRHLADDDRPVHILVNNSGGPPPGPIADTRADAFLATFKEHLMMSHMLVQLCLHDMRSAGYGRIINITSTSVKQPIPNLGLSNTIRAAVANWAKTLSREVGGDGITVNNVLPGATQTERLMEIISKKARRKGVSQSEIRQEMVADIPIGRFATVSDIARAVSFLASPAASYITGINLPVDGGRTLCL